MIKLDLKFTSNVCQLNIFETEKHQREKEKQREKHRERNTKRERETERMSRVVCVCVWERKSVCVVPLVQ